MRFLIVTGLITASILAFLKGGEGVMVYPFDPRHVTPAEAGEPRLREEVLTTSDGQSLIVWTAKAAQGRPTLIYFHGNGGGLKERVQRFDRLLDRGYGLIAPAYRRSSGSTGTPTEAALSQDAIEIVQHFSPAAPVIYFGESLGTGVAVKLAMTRAPAGIILEAPYTSIPDVARKTYPIPGLRLLMREIWDTEKNITKVPVPTLILHGTEDQVVPFDMGLRVFDASPAPRKTMIRARGLGHHNLWTSENQMSMYRFIDALP